MGLIGTCDRCLRGTNVEEKRSIKAQELIGACRSRVWDRDSTRREKNHKNGTFSTLFIPIPLYMKLETSFCFISLLLLLGNQNWCHKKFFVAHWYLEFDMGIDFVGTKRLYQPIFFTSMKNERVYQDLTIPYLRELKTWQCNNRVTWINLVYLQIYYMLVVSRFLTSILA